MERNNATIKYEGHLSDVFGNLCTYSITSCRIIVQFWSNCGDVWFFFYRKRQAKMQKELEDAVRDTRPISPDRSSLKEGISGLPTAVPTKVSVTFVRWQNFNLWNYFYSHAITVENFRTNVYQSVVTRICMFCMTVQEHADRETGCLNYWTNANNR